MIRTVADLIAALQQLDASLPVVRLVYDPHRGVASTLALYPLTVRCQCPADADAFSSEVDGVRVNVPHYFELGTPAALYHEERGGELKQVVLIAGGN